MKKNLLFLIISIGWFAISIIYLQKHLIIEKSKVNSFVKKNNIKKKSFIEKNFVILYKNKPSGKINTLFEIGKLQNLHINILLNISENKKLHKLNTNISIYGTYGNFIKKFLIKINDSKETIHCIGKFTKTSLDIHVLSKKQNLKHSFNIKKIPKLFYPVYPFQSGDYIKRIKKFNIPKKIILYNPINKAPSIAYVKPLNLKSNILNTPLKEYLLRYKTFECNISLSEFGEIFCIKTNKYYAIKQTNKDITITNGFIIDKILKKKFYTFFINNLTKILKIKQTNTK